MRFVVGIAHPVAGWRQEAQVHDIGLGGAGLEITAATVRPSDRVLLSFIAPTLWDPLEIPARVAWLRAAPRHRMPGAPFSDGEFLRLGVAFEIDDPTKMLALFELVSAFVFDR